MAYPSPVCRGCRPPRPLGALDASEQGGGEELGPPLADPEETRLVELISLLKVSQDTLAVAKYQRQRDEFRSKRAETPLSVDAAIAAKEEAEQELAWALEEVEAIQGELVQATRKVEVATAKLDSATAAYSGSRAGRPGGASGARRQGRHLGPSQALHRPHPRRQVLGA